MNRDMIKRQIKQKIADAKENGTTNNYQKQKGETAEFAAWRQAENDFNNSKLNKQMKETSEYLKHDPLAVMTPMIGVGHSVVSGSIRVFELFLGKTKNINSKRRK